MAGTESDIPDHDSYHRGYSDEKFSIGLIPVKIPDQDNLDQLDRADQLFDVHRSISFESLHHSLSICLTKGSSNNRRFYSFHVVMIIF
jgi:hypothetical protein